VPGEDSVVIFSQGMQVKISIISIRTNRLANPGRLRTQTKKKRRKEALLKASGVSSREKWRLTLNFLPLSRTKGGGAAIRIADARPRKTDRATRDLG